MYILGAICILLIGYIAFKEWLSKDTVKDLSAKIMAKDVRDYVYMANSAKKEEAVPVVEENLIPLDESDAWNSKEDFLQAINSGKIGKNGKK